MLYLTKKLSEEEQIHYKAQLEQRKKLEECQQCERWRDDLISNSNVWNADPRPNCAIYAKGDG